MIILPRKSVFTKNVRNVGEEMAMNAAGSSCEQVDDAGARRFEVNVEASEKPVEPLAVDQAHNRGPVGDRPQEATREKRDEKLDLWMKNIKEFIRNIDVKSL
jgi:hypothetical protein